MKKKLIGIFLAMFLVGCTAPGQVGVNTPQGKAAAYPPAIEETVARKQSAEESWKKFLSDFRLPEAPADLEPGLLTLRALSPDFAGKIKLSEKSAGLNQLEATEALRRFLERAPVLFGPETAMNLRDLSLTSMTADGNFYRAEYRQTNYSHPIANGYGELRLTMGKDGTLLQASSRLIPKVDLPAVPEVTRSTLVERMIGKEFTYSNFAGQPMRYKAAEASEIKVGELVVVPKIEESKLTVHLAYPVQVGRGMTWTVYVDAINGRELEVKQNFAT